MVRSAIEESAYLLTPENITEVYGVEAMVMGNLERPYLVPIKSLQV